LGTGPDFRVSKEIAGGTWRVGRGGRVQARKSLGWEKTNQEKKGGEQLCSCIKEVGKKVVPRHQKEKVQQPCEGPTFLDSQKKKTDE